MLAAPSLLIVDDHPLFTDGLVQLLARSHPDMRIGSACSSAEALKMLRMQGYDMVLADWKLADGDGLALLVQVAQIDPTVVRLLCSGADDYHLAQQARAAGLMGFLPKALSPRAFGAALDQVIAGQPWYPSPSLPNVRLTQRQLSILQMAVSGAPNKIIARNLAITERTVKFHLAAAFVRLGTKKRTEAVTRAVQLGMIALPANKSN